MHIPLLDNVMAALPEPEPAGGPLSVRVVGDSGPTVVLIHGLGRVAATWADVAHLSRPHFRLILADNPGLGRSSHLPVPKRVEDHARMWAETLESLGVSGPIHVAGLSLGGMIAITLASQLGSRAATVTAFSSSARETGFWRLDGRALLRMGGRVMAGCRADHRVSIHEIVSAELLERDPELAHRVDRIQTAEGFRPQNGLRQLVAAARWRVQPHLVRQPPVRHVAVGKEDRLVPPSNSRRLAERLGATFEELPGRGHDLSLDAPDAVVRILRTVTGT